MTRVAGGDPALYGQIVAGNSEAVVDLLAEVRDRLDVVIDARRRLRPGPLQQLLEQGVAGTLAIPGKHGGPTRPTGSVFVSVPDHPGELARLFADAGASEVNIEDVHIDHDPGRAGRAGRAAGRRGARGAPAGLSRIQGLGDPPVGWSVVSNGVPGIVVAVDGTSGSGKSSTSRGVADRLGLRYLDTGAMYRAMTWWMLRHGVDVHDAAAVAARCGEPLIESGTDPLAPTITVDGEDVAAAIRQPDVNAAVSPVSAVPEVRARLLTIQRAAIDAALAGPGIVVEGRDIGSVVWPEAPVKVYLSADASARATRRAAEEGGSDLDGHRGVAAGPRPDRLRPRRLAPGDGRGRGPHRHDGVLPRRGGRPGGRAGRRGPERRMTTRQRELPASARRHPARFLLYPLRPLARFVIRRRVKVRVVNGEKLPQKGPVILASNHVGVADGPLLAIFGPRPVHALTKQEMFKGFMNGFLLGAGQIPLDRFNADPLAVKRCLRVLRSGRVIGIFPEGSRGAGEFDRFHTGAAYLAMVTGAPIVPVVQFGTREPGAGSHALPAKGVVVDMVFGDAINLPRRAVAAAQAGRREGVPRPARAPDRAPRRRQGAHRPDPARAAPGRGLRRPDPATGVTDQEAM